MSDDFSSLVEQLHTEVGDALRFVASYHEDDHDVLYIRDDVGEARPQSVIEAAFEEAVFQETGRPYVESKLQSGRLRSIVQSFDQLFLVNFITDEQSGFIVTVEPNFEGEFQSFIRTYERRFAGE